MIDWDGCGSLPNAAYLNWLFFESAEYSNDGDIVAVNDFVRAVYAKYGREFNQQEWDQLVERLSEEAADQSLYHDRVQR